MEHCRGTIKGENLMPGRSKESMERQLKINYRNLDELEERRSKFGINAPIDLINQIHDVREEIAHIEEMLSNKSFAEDSPSNVIKLRAQVEYREIMISAGPAGP
jgi:hypothetical protein